MLRITTPETGRSTAAAEAERAPVMATGNTGSAEPPALIEPIPAPAAAPSATATSPDPASAEAPAPAPETPARNLGAQILPWLTEEVVFHSVLDMGCGSGEAVRILNAAGYEAHGVDVAATADDAARIRRGDMLDVPQENGYFDMVICADAAHLIGAHRVSALLAEIDRLSNSYVLISVPSAEGDGPLGDVAWWSQRIADFGWRYRLLREDPDMNQLVILAEKPNSLAAQVLPHLDIGQPTAAPQPQGAVALVDEALALFRAGETREAFAKISEMADFLLGLEQPLEALHPVFSEIVDSMEKGDSPRVVELLETRLRPALQPC